MKKIISLVLIIFILICSIPAVSVFSLGGSSGDCTWELDGTALVISGNGAMSNYDRVLAPWGKEITEVVIQNGVTTIGQYAFADCKNLVNVSLPESLVYIRDNAFEGCASLKEIMVPSSVKEIKPGAFYNCSALQNIVLPEGLSLLGDSAFFGCSSLKTVVLPTGIKSISGYTFYECSALENVVLLGDVATIGYKAFYRCTAIKNITLPMAVKSISISAFEGCNTLSDVWYGGDETAKGKVVISSKNTPLQSASWHFSCGVSLEKTPDCRVNGKINISEGEVDNAYSVVLPKAPHHFGIWTVETPPSCSKNGVKVKQCKACGYEENAQISMLGHTFSDWEMRLAPSCEKEGKKERVCSVCKAQEEQFVAALGHNYNILVNSNSADCSQGGQTTLKCSACRNNSVTQTTSGHVYKNGSCIYCDIGAKVVESKHNYDSNCDIKQKISFPSAQKLTISFSKSTYTEAEYDFIYIIDSKGNIKSKNSGGMLSGRTITVDGNTVTIHLQTDESGEEYGYFATVTPHSLLGDTDGNGTLDALDVSGVMNGVLTGDNNLCFDINDDGLVNLVDLIRIKKLLTA